MLTSGGRPHPFTVCRVERSAYGPFWPLAPLRIRRPARSLLLLQDREALTVFGLIDLPGGVALGQPGHSGAPAVATVAAPAGHQDATVRKARSQKIGKIGHHGPGPSQWSWAASVEPAAMTVDNMISPSTTGVAGRTKSTRIWPILPPISTVSLDLRCLSRRILGTREGSGGPAGADETGLVGEDDEPARRPGRRGQSGRRGRRVRADRAGPGPRRTCRPSGRRRGKQDPARPREATCGAIAPGPSCPRLSPLATAHAGVMGRAAQP